MPAPLIAASLLAADAARLGDEASTVTAAGADWLHLDIMDGQFVSNLSFGPATAAAIKRHSHLPLDVHLMVMAPLAQIEGFAAAGADRITVHVEADGDTSATLAAIRACGKQAGLALKPDTPLDAVLPYLDQIDLLLVMTVEPGAGGQAFRVDQLPKIVAARQAIAATGRSIYLQVDGGITPTTARQVCDVGADVLVAGTAIFKADNYNAAIAALRGAA